MKTAFGATLLAGLMFGSCGAETEPGPHHGLASPALAGCVISRWPYIPQDAAPLMVDIPNGDPERTIIVGQAMVALTKASIRVTPVSPLKRLPEDGRTVHLGPLDAAFTASCWQPTAANAPGHYLLSPNMIAIFDGSKPADGALPTPPVPAA